MDLMIFFWMMHSWDLEVIIAKNYVGRIQSGFSSRWERPIAFRDFKILTEYQGGLNLVKCHAYATTENAKNKVLAFNQEEREALLAFLNDLWVLFIIYLQESKWNWKIITSPDEVGFAQSTAFSRR